MTDDRIKRLREIATSLGVTGWTDMAKDVRHAADELERLHKIEAEAMETLISSVTGNLPMILNKMTALNNAMRANPQESKQ